MDDRIVSTGFRENEDEQEQSLRPKTLREEALRVYNEAVRERYRFFSFGDCMLIL